MLVCARCLPTLPTYVIDVEKAAYLQDENNFRKDLKKS